MRKEVELILLAVLKNKTQVERDRVTALLTEDLDWIFIGGILLNHRLSGYFFVGLDDVQKVNVPKELRAIFRLIIFAQAQRQTMINHEVDKINAQLVKHEVHFAGIKGILFGTEIYVTGERRSNDVDLLVYEPDLSTLDTAMRELGYIQSNCPNGKLVEASKKEKLIQRMNYHDLVPYVKQVEDIILEIDINFLFDGKDNPTDKFLYDDGLYEYTGKEYTITGLSHRAHLAFLLVHFYREATNSIWTKDKRDLTFYKIVDIINYIRHIKNEVDCTELVEFFRKLNIAGKCYYVFKVICEFYQDDFIEEMLSLLEPDATDTLGQIYDISEKRYKRREQSFYSAIFGEESIEL